MNIKAVIFDMDGVISDTQSICAQVESILLKEYGIFISPEELTDAYAGTISYEMFPAVFKQYGKEMPDITRLAQERWDRIFNATRGNIKAIPGTISFIKKLKKEKMPIAVASASRIDFITLVLSELDLLSDFDVITSAQEVLKGKPEPDVFLLAAKRLRIEACDCLVVEDGLHGMTAAKRAGMKCIALVRKGRIDKNIYKDITIAVVRSLEALELKYL